MSRPHQAIAAALLLAGCTSLYPPKSADEFRRAASASLLPKTGSLEVARPLPQVSDDLRKKSAECLDVSVTAVTKTITDFQEIIRTYYVTYKPTVVAAPERTRPRWYWFDDRAASRVLQMRLSYHALSRHYRLSSGLLQQNFSSLEEALNVLKRVRNWLVVDRTATFSDAEYEASVRMRLDTAMLPRPFQLSALTSRELQLDSPWRRFSVRPRQVPAPVETRQPAGAAK